MLNCPDMVIFEEGARGPRWHELTSTRRSIIMIKVAEQNWKLKVRLGYEAREDM